MVVSSFHSTIKTIVIVIAILMSRITKCYCGTYCEKLELQYTDINL